MTRNLEAENARLRKALSKVCVVETGGSMDWSVNSTEISCSINLADWKLERDAALSPPSASGPSNSEIGTEKTATVSNRDPGSPLVGEVGQQLSPSANEQSENARLRKAFRFLSPPSAREQNTELGTFDEPRLVALTASATEEAKRETYTWLAPSIVLELIRNLRAARFERDTALSPPSAREQSAARDVLAERERQKAVEGWTAEHDDAYHDGALGQAASCYAMMTPKQNFWPVSWDLSWFKPKDRRHNLVRAGALIIAEIERLDRKQKLDDHSAAIDRKHPTAARRRDVSPSEQNAPSVPIASEQDVSSSRVSLIDMADQFEPALWGSNLKLLETLLTQARADEAKFLVSLLDEISKSYTGGAEAGLRVGAEAIRAHAADRSTSEPMRDEERVANLIRAASRGEPIVLD